MKKLILLLSAAAMLATAACSSFSNRGEVDRPMIASSSQDYMGIEKVVLSDTATVVYSVVHFSPGAWISIDDSSYITDGTGRYRLMHTDGITPGEHLTMPDSGVVRFTMTFPAIAAGAESIDFSEGTPGGWNIWGIDLTGKAGHDINLGAVPAALRGELAMTSLPESTIAFGDSTTVNIHILGYRPEMGDKLLWAMNTVHGQIGTDTPATVDSLGNATIRTALSAPAEIIVIGFDFRHPLSGGTLLEPGETVDLYIDSHLWGIRNMAVRDNVRSVYARPEGYSPSYASGRYKGLKNAFGPDYYGMQFHGCDFGDYHMNGDEYTAYVLDRYKSLKDSLDANTSLPAAARQYWESSLRGDLIYAASNARNIMRLQYYCKHGNWGAAVDPDSLPVKLSPENVKAIAALVDFNDSKLLLLNNINEMYDTDIWKDAGIDPGILETVRLYNEAYEAANDVRTDTAALAELRRLAAPMADEVEAHYKARKARLDALDASLISPTPDVAPERIFDAIVAPHKGKVVMVDLWNTWCAPCRAAIAQNEPEKSGDLASDDIVWIYIADESSPMPDYLSMIKNIRGQHYRLTKDEISVIRKRFDVDGIPFYILVDRRGKAAPRPDLRNHASFKSAIRAALKER